MKSVQLDNETPMRLDLALASALGISRSKLQQVIKDGRVQVDGETATPHTAVNASSVITVDESVTAPKEGPKGELPALDILYEDADLLVLNKPAGVLVHPTSDSNEHTLADALLAVYPDMCTVGDVPLRAGLVHRLDREASGVLVAAKTREAFLFLKRQFKDRLTTKKYTVLVLGNVRGDAGTISFPIARSVTRGRMAARPHSQEGREAVTHFDVLERFPQCTLLDVAIETGRTHQIRAHFFALQHPVVGDPLYVQRGMKQMDAGRLFLHARELTLELPNGGTQTFTAPLAPELFQFLEELRARYANITTPRV